MGNTKHNTQIIQSPTAADAIQPSLLKRKAGCLSARPGLLLLLLGSIIAVLPGAVSAQTIWYSGQRAFGQVKVEPAVDYATGNEIFLLTPNNSPFPSKAAAVAHAPLYLVMYPKTPASTRTV